jgi:outer membrane protein TolC
MLRIQKWGLVGVLLAAVVLASTPRLLGAPVPGGKENSAEVKKLLVQRRDHLRKSVDAMRKEYEVGRRTLHSLLGTMKQLRDAELELASNSAGRQAAHLEFFRFTVELDEKLLAAFEAGRVSPAEFHEVRAERLQAEIDLRRAGGVPPRDIKPAREPADFKREEKK